MKIFIVCLTDDPYCGVGYIEGVFDSYDKANAFVIKRSNELNYKSDDFEIYEEVVQ